MIKTALIAMTLMGCDCDARLCEYIGETPARWATVADCEAAMRDEIRAKGHLDYPLISGFCRQAPDDMVVASITPDQVLPAPPAAPPQSSGLYAGMVGSGRVVFRKTVGGYEMVKNSVENAIERTIGFARWSASAVLPARFTGN